MRTTLAVIAGIIIANIAIFGIESWGHKMYPMPAGMDFNNPKHIESFIKTAPLGALLFVLLAYTVGGLVGGYVTARLSRSRQMIFPVITGLVLLIFTVANIVLIPQPMWFSVASLLLIFGATWCGGKVGNRLS